MAHTDIAGGAMHCYITPPLPPPIIPKSTTCETCLKEDVCMYKEELNKAIKDIADIADRTNVFIETDIRCCKWTRKPDSYMKD